MRANKHVIVKLIERSFDLIRKSSRISAVESSVKNMHAAPSRIAISLQTLLQAE
jgi:hypothetical protein